MSAPGTVAGGTASAAGQGPAILAPAAPAASTSGHITVEAVAASWVQVREVGGKVLYDHVLKTGETWAVPPDPLPLTLATGNAGGVRLMADGVTSPALGRVGGVRRGIPLSVQSIKDGSIATPAGPASPGEATVKSGQDGGEPAPVLAGSSTGHIRPSHPRPPAAPGSDDATERLNERQLATPR